MPGKQVSLDFRIGKTNSNVSHNDGRIESFSFVGLHSELKIDLNGHILNAYTYAANEIVSCKLISIVDGKKSVMNLLKMMFLVKSWVTKILFDFWIKWCDKK